MRLGLWSGGSVTEIVADASWGDQVGLSTVSAPQTTGADATVALAVAGAKTERIGLTSAVVPIFGRQPIALAQQALSVQEASDGRFTLGIGLAHQVIVEGTLGLSFERPGAAMAEFLEVLMPVLRGEEVQHEGERWTLRGDGLLGRLQVPDLPPPRVLLAAMAPVMLRLAGRLTNGTILVNSGPKAIAEYIAPRLHRAADEAGRRDIELVASLPISLVSDPAAARERAAAQSAGRPVLPSYRSMLDASGASGPADVALIGDARALDSALLELENAGVTEFLARPSEFEEGAEARTREFIADRAPSYNSV